MNSNNRHDLSELIQRFGNGVYRDYEGLADGALVLEACQAHRIHLGNGTQKVEYLWETFLGPKATCEPIEHYEQLLDAARDITLNLLYEELDEGDKEVVLSEENVRTTCYVVCTLLTCRFWTKSGLPETSGIPR